MNNLTRYIETLRTSITETADFVETLTDAERIELRKELEKIGCTKLVRTLYYNYKSQKWIE